MSWFFPALLMRSGLSRKPPAGSVDYEGSRCSSEIRINVRLTVRWESPCLSFILLSICQCQSVNYRFIYLVTPVRTDDKRVAPPLLKGKRLFSRGVLPFTNTVSHTLWFCCTCSCSLVSSVSMIRSCTPGSRFATAPSTTNPCLWPHLEQDTRPDH